MTDDLTHNLPESPTCSMLPPVHRYGGRKCYRGRLREHGKVKWVRLTEDKLESQKIMARLLDESQVLAEAKTKALPYIRKIKSSTHYYGASSPDEHGRRQTIKLSTDYAESQKMLAELRKASPRRMKMTQSRAAQMAIVELLLAAGIIKMPEDCSEDFSDD